jgi:hypothetical protein
MDSSEYSDGLLFMIATAQTSLIVSDPEKGLPPDDISSWQEKTATSKRLQATKTERRERRDGACYVEMLMDGEDFTFCECTCQGLILMNSVS